MANLVFNGEDLGPFTALPESTQQAILSRVTGHFNNEVSSARIAWAKSQLANGEGSASDIPTADARAYYESHAAEAKAFVDEWFATKRKQILDGTLGVRSSAPTVDPLEAIMHRMAKAEIKALVGKSFPTKDGDVYVGVGGRKFEGKAGGDEMAQAWLHAVDKAGKFGRAGSENHPRIEAAAKRELASRQKLKAVEADAESIGI